MACPLCGDRCTCSSGTTGTVIAGSSVSVLIEPEREPSTNLSTSANGRASAERRDSDWRGEVANRVQAHRARRRRRYDPDSSLSLSFASSASANSGEATGDGGGGPAQYQQTSSAEELSYESPVGVREDEAEAEVEDSRPSPYRRILLKPVAEESAIADDKIIQFPRSAEQDRLFEDELAEAISATPRILDVEPPQAAEEASSNGTKLPPLATFHLDDFVSSIQAGQWADEAGESEIELPLQVAPMGARTMSALTDMVVVMTAAALFGVIVLSIAKFVPQGRVAAAIGLLLPLTLWAAYHYLFLVYAGRTPGMQMAQLELSSFEGCVPTRKVRGWRAVSMLLSCTSLGLGFAWAAVDEDRLSWHDRITRTYLRQG